MWISAAEGVPYEVRLLQSFTCQENLTVEQERKHSAQWPTYTHTHSTEIMFTELISHCNTAVCVCAGAAVPEQLSLSPCATPSSEWSEVTPGSRLNMVMTPNTPELYSALKLPYRSNVWHCTSCTARFSAQLDSTVLFCVSGQNGSFSHLMNAARTGPFSLHGSVSWAGNVVVVFFENQCFQRYIFDQIK